MGGSILRHNPFFIPKADSFWTFLAEVACGSREEAAKIAILKSITLETLVLAANGSNFHEWGAASPENLFAGLIRVHSWFKCAALGHPGRTGSFAFPAD
jgi:hypothetical protein